MRGVSLSFVCVVIFIVGIARVEVVVLANIRLAIVCSYLFYMQGWLLNFPVFLAIIIMCLIVSHDPLHCRQYLHIFCIYLQATCKAIGIPDELTYYFGLFMEYSSTDGKWTSKGQTVWLHPNINIVCFLALHCFCDFQCPYLSLLAGSRSVEYKFRLSIKRWWV